MLAGTGSVRRSWNVLVVLFALSSLAAAAGERAPRGAGATIHVPQDQPTIQAGVDAAVDGDQVVVAAGTYTGPGNRDIDFQG